MLGGCTRLHLCYTITMTLYSRVHPFLSYEKMISGKYLGEIARLALQKLVKCGNLFGGKSSTKFDTFEAFESKYVSIIEGRFVNYLYHVIVIQ